MYRTVSHFKLTWFQQLALVIDQHLVVAASMIDGQVTTFLHVNQRIYTRTTQR